MEFPVTLELPDAGTYRFRRAEDLRDFVQHELDFISLLRKVAVSSDRHPKLSQSLHHQFHWTVTLRDILAEPQRMAEARNVYDNWIGTGFPVPLSHSPRGKFLSEINSRAGAQAAIGALAMMLSTPFNSDDPMMLRGAVEAINFLNNVGPGARKSVQDSLSDMLTRLSEQQRRAEDKADALDRRAESFDKTQKRWLQRALAAGSNARKEMATSIYGDANAAIDSIRATQSTYEEHMALRGPVQYWTDKAESHRKKANGARNVGIAFAVVIIFYVYADGATRLLDLVERAIRETGQWHVAYVVLTVAILVLTLVFWFGRLISRTYVSHAHLTTDAEERATMVQTYLALTNEGKISDTERNLVLAALFRSSSDGLVKDDAVPDLSLAGLLSKAGVGR